MTFRPWISRPFLVAAVALTVLFVLLLMAVTRLAGNETRLSGEPAEGVIWFSSQGQYEAMRLADTIMLFEAERVSRNELILRFDLLDSRLGLFEAGHLTRRVADMAYDDDIAALRDTLEVHRKDLADLLPTDTVRIVELHDMAQHAAQTMRDLANAGMLDGRARQELVSEGRRKILFEVLGYLLATLVAGVLVAIILVRGLRTTVRAEAALQHEREISRLHRAFTSMVSHQFRTPLSIIDASAQRMLRRGAAMSTDELSTRVTKIRHACQRLTRLMESTLNAARLEQGEIGFNARPCDLHRLVATVCESQPDEDQGRIVQVLEGLPRLAVVDGTLLEQAVHNLISNALKYSPSASSIVVRGERRGDAVVIDVEDRGVGIPADEIGFITERFFRARTAEGIAGTGIGLNFVLQIMRLHGGRLDIQSVEGEGSTFTLIFPYRQVEQGSYVSASAARWVGDPA